MGSGVSQPFVDPKGHDVTLSGTSISIESQSKPETPRLINCRNVSFKFIPGDEEEDEEESEGEGTDKEYIPSPKPNIPKGHVNDKKSKFEKQTPAKNARDAKELAKQNRNYRKNSKLPGPTSKQNERNKKEEEQNPVKDEEMETENLQQKKDPKTENLQQKKDPKENENLQQKKDQKENENLQQKNDKKDEDSAIMRLLTKMDRRMENMESDIKLIKVKVDQNDEK